MNDAMQRLEGLVGEWTVTMTHAWFLDSLDTEIHGTATFTWFADAFIVMESRFEDDAVPTQASGWPRAWAAVYGRSDARDAYEVFYYDERGVYRVFDMTFAGGEWTQLREDPDLHQRIVMHIRPDRIDMRADASEDAGMTWRKDLDYIFRRRGGNGQ